MTTKWLAGMRVTANRLNAMNKPPVCRVVQKATGQSLVSGGWYPILFTDNPGSVIVDNFGGFSFSSAGRYTSRLASWYDVGGCVVFNQSATGGRGAQIYKNGTAVQGVGDFDSVVSGSLITTVSISPGPVYLDVGDYVELRGWQNSGGPLATFVAGDQTSMLSVKWLGT